MRLAGIIAALLLAGCTGERGPEPARPTRPAGGGPVRRLEPVRPPRPSVPRDDPRSRSLMAVHMTLHRMTVPWGAVSRSEEFWKHVDEQAVDPAAAARLQVNGFRVGIGRADDWPYFRRLLEQHPVERQVESCLRPETAGFMTLEMKLSVDVQTIFDFGPGGVMTGRTYEKCDNLLAVSFQPAPRKIGYVRVALTPVVRSLRTRLVAVGDVEQTEVKFVHPEKYFDLGLTVNVAMDDFLVVAPSPHAAASTSLGRHFLVADAAAERTEQVLIFVPRVYRTPDEAPGRPSTVPAGRGP